MAQLVVDDVSVTAVSDDSNRLDVDEISVETSEAGECSSVVVLDDDDEVTILGEILGAYNLVEDCVTHRRTAEDIHQAYCMVKFGQKFIHRTKPSAVEDAQNPIWTISTRSLFLLSVTPHELTHHDLRVSVWSKRKGPLMIAARETRCLGEAVLNCSSILSHCDEQILDVALRDRNENNESADCGTRGCLSLRFRLATPTDENFVRLFQRRPDLLTATSKTDVYNAIQQQHTFDTVTSLPTDSAARPIAPLATETNETQLARASLVKSLSSAFTSKRFFDDKAGEQKVLVKPYPDSDRINETTYMTKQEIKTETFAPSKQWVEAGSGTLGKLYVEVLACHDLPNTDVGEAVGNVTDGFICLLFEDAMAQTTVIDDELSPHWLPWTQRAFVFGLMHPSSTLYLGAFDFDFGPANHDPVGRVAVNIGNFQRDTDYTLQYALHATSNVGTERTPAGTITIRLRIEYFDEKELLMAALRPRPKFYINTCKEKSLAAVRYTCFGEYGDDNEENFDLTVLRSYISEIFEYKNYLFYYIGDAFRSLVFWRGQVMVFDSLLPLHSFLFFWSAATLVEYPHLAPSFLLLSVAWIMLAMCTLNQQHPSPWNKCPSFQHFVEILKTGKSSLRITRIDANERAEEAEAYEKAWSDRLEKDQHVAATRAALQQKISTIGDDDIQTKITSLIPLDLLERLGRYQGIIARWLKKMRFIRIILIWEESIISFWITASFLAGGLVSLILPWKFILLWTGRILVWGLLGPHMKLVDMVLRDGTEEGGGINEALEKFKKESLTARHRKQDAVKLKDIKCLSFGKYITLVPSFNLSRHYDRPLPGSFAELHTKESAPVELARHWIPGQQFFGAIIPRTLHDAELHKLELPRIEKLLSALEHRVKEIQESENFELIKRLMEKSSQAQEEDMPSSVGFELISCNRSFGRRHVQVPINETSTLHLLPKESNVAILQTQKRHSSGLRRRRSAGKSLRRSSLGLGFEILPFEEDDEMSCLRMSQSSPLHMNNERGLAILETEERKVGRQKSAIQHQLVDLIDTNEREPTTLVEERKEDKEDDEAVEVILSLSKKQADRAAPGKEAYESGEKSDGSLTRAKGYSFDQGPNHEGRDASPCTDDCELLKTADSNNDRDPASDTAHLVHYQA